MPRLFFGVPVQLPSAAASALAELAAFGRPIKAVDPAAAHFTLRFLGDLPASWVDDLGRAASAAARGEAALATRIAGVGAFPHAGRPKVVWAGIADPEPLERMEQALRQRLDALCLPGPDKPFSPHLTLARVKARPPDSLAAWLERYGEADLGPVTLDRLVLFESELTPRGPSYNRRVEATLSGE